MKEKLRFRQIHLDFHTSPLIPKIGEKFNKREFGEALEKAKVNSVTCFARCHHGYLYYDSKVNAERIHPHLENKNLLKEQIDECHRRGIKVPIYTTVQWDRYSFDKHPEWAAVDLEGNVINGQGGKEGFYDVLCLNTPYRNFLKDHVKDILDYFGAEVDGLFFDILFATPCACEKCKEKMKFLNFDYTNKDDRIKYSEIMLNEFRKEMTEYVLKINANISVFYNSSNISPDLRDSLEAYTHLELESLPSGGWGYMHFPITMRYAENLGKECMGMTGKFHTYWGDFHSFKNLEALQYECFNMLALNAKCSIGDQLEPNGKISSHVYDLIGKVYSEVEKKEPWCVEAISVREIGVMSTAEFKKFDNDNMLDIDDALMGVCRMLMEEGVQFTIVDSKSDFSKYKLLVLPEIIVMDNNLSAKINNFVKQGGKVISSYKSGLGISQTDFVMSFMKVKYDSLCEYKPNFIIPKGEIGKGLYNTEYTMYSEALNVNLQGGGECLLEIILPYFNRTAEHYCSHQHAPSSGKKGGAAVIKGENSIYFAHRIFSQYSLNGSIWCKKLFINALDMLLENRLITHDGPTTLRVTLNNQENEDRYVMHLLHYIPEKRTKQIEVIQDIIPLYNIEFNMNLPKKVKGIKLVPEEINLEFSEKNNKINFNVPKIYGHQIIELVY